GRGARTPPAPAAVAVVAERHLRPDRLRYPAGAGEFLRLEAGPAVEVPLHLLDRIPVEVTEEEAGEEVGSKPEEEEHHRNGENADQEVGEGQTPAHLP